MFDINFIMIPKNHLIKLAIEVASQIAINPMFLMNSRIDITSLDWIA